MNLRHAAAPSLVAWCLVMPPVSQSQQSIEKNAPLSRWETIGSYDTADACTNELAKLTTLVAGNITYSLIQRRTLAGKCVAADDPRLHADNYDAY